MAVNHRKLRIAVLTIGGIPFQEQCRIINLVNNTDDPEIFHTFGGDNSSFAEEAEPSWALELTAYADWRSDGISDFLTAHNGETLPFVADMHPNIVGEHTRRAGDVLIKAPSVGGEIRATEETETTLAVIGEPSYERIG